MLGLTRVSARRLSALLAGLLLAVPPLPPEGTGKRNVSSDAIPTTCEVHGERLRNGKAAVVYGLLELPDTYCDARRREFPLSRTWQPGGCLVWDDAPKTVMVIFCQSCRSAEADWRKAHPEVFGGN